MIGSTGAVGAGVPAGAAGKLGHEKLGRLGRLGRLGSAGSDGTGNWTLAISLNTLADSSSPKRSQKSRVPKVDCAETCWDEIAAKLNNAKKTDDLVNAMSMNV